MEDARFITRLKDKFPTINDTKIEKLLFYIPTSKGVNAQWKIWWEVRQNGKNSVKLFCKYD